ncbi:hypothetical protein [Alysiella sp.]|uniref:hypothetical protein n=1 Tax=Alysiella sp. TaxID=1872483 RepID=UPI0026DDABB2|nr:hypothetical protein [Alysiella sp.]
MAALSSQIQQIAYPLRTLITQIEPRLDVFWQEQLLEIFRGITPQERKDVLTQLLEPKGIFWHAQAQKFEYREQHLPFSEWIKNIPAGAKNLKILAVRLLDSLNILSTYEDINHVADYLDNIFVQISQVKVQNNVENQVWKQKLHDEFIYAVASVVRNNQTWQVPKNLRGLNIPILKTFICEVFLKRQLLGYWFKTQRNRQLAEMPQPLIHDFLCREQRIRQLEVVRASKYFFAIAPTLESGINPFTLRRFLQEDRLFSNQRVLFNGVAVNTALLNQYDEIYQEKFKKQVSCIITIEANISRVVVDFVHELENYHDDVLMPFLFEPFDLGQIDLLAAVEKRLALYEEMLNKHILLRLRYALLNYAKNSDEFEYLYVAARQLFGSILAVFKDFQTLPAVLMNVSADIMFGRLVGYATFLEKRHDDIFVVQSEEMWQAHNARLREPLKKVVETVSQHIGLYQKRCAEAEQQALVLAKPENFWGKLLKKREKQTKKWEESKKAAREIVYQVHQSLMNLPKDFTLEMVYLEFDAKLITDEKQRNYAFPSGDNGMTQLPVVLTLPENRLHFDLNEFIKQLEEKIGKKIQQDDGH